MERCTRAVDAGEARQVWALPMGTSLSWREWDPSEAVVFDRGSGGTHLLDAFSAAVLRAISQRPRRLDDLACDLAAHAGASEGEVRARLGEVLEKLQQLGLLERV